MAASDSPAKATAAEPAPLQHKDHHSAQVKGHVKKDGAGGKFTFGKVGDEDGPAVLDKGDPNYDSEAEEEKKTKAERKSEAKEAAIAAAGVASAEAAAVLENADSLPPAKTFESMGQRLYSGQVKSESNKYVWVILQGEDAPRIVGTYSTKEKARAKVEAVISKENDVLKVGWKEEPEDTWKCNCDTVRIDQYPVDPKL
mmetsp:Transcript_44554/g.88284  ORF Transcript_44554/g.88284 Transcript_44554/m.88284 type:complete len:199 (-) Transcript_44554:243-839(-)